jgi:hypothetical protein
MESRRSISERASAMMKYIIREYDRVRHEEKPLPKQALEQVKGFIYSVAAAIQRNIYSSNKVIEADNSDDIRKFYCDKFLVRADEIKPDNIAQLLSDIGHAAYTVQEEQAASIHPAMSLFMQYFCGLNQILLFYFLDLKDSENKSHENEQKAFSDPILKERELTIQKLNQKIGNNEAEIADGCSDENDDIMNKSINMLRHKLVSLGDLKLIRNRNDRQMMYDPQYYIKDKNDPLPSYPSVVQRHYAAKLARLIYEKRSLLLAGKPDSEKRISLAGKSDHEIMLIVEKDALKQLDNEKKAQLDLVSKEAKDAKAKADEAEAKLKESGQLVGKPAPEGVSSSNVLVSQALHSASNPSSASALISSSSSSSLSVPVSSSSSSSSSVPISSSSSSSSNVSVLSSSSSSSSDSISSCSSSSASFSSQAPSHDSNLNVPLFSLLNSSFQDLSSSSRFSFSSQSLPARPSSQASSSSSASSSSQASSSSSNEQRTSSRRKGFGNS